MNKRKDLIKKLYTIIASGKKEAADWKSKYEKLQKKYDKNIADSISHDKAMRDKIFNISSSVKRIKENVQ